MNWNNLKPETPSYDPYRLVAIAVGAAARILVKLGYTAEQSAELMKDAWYIVQK